MYLVLKPVNNIVLSKTGDLINGAAAAPQHNRYQSRGVCV